MKDLKAEPGAGGGGPIADDREKLMNALIVVMQSWNRCRACGLENDDEHDALPHSFDAPSDDELVTLFLEELRGVGLDVAWAGAAGAARLETGEVCHTAEGVTGHTSQTVNSMHYLEAAGAALAPLEALRKAVATYMASDESGNVEALDKLERATQALIIAAVDLIEHDEAARGGDPAPADWPETKEAERAFRDGYAMGYAARHDGQSMQPTYALTRWRGLIKLAPADPSPPEAR